LPKGIADGESFNDGYTDGKQAIATKLEHKLSGIRATPNLKPKKGEVVSTHLYEMGFAAAKNKAQYDSFKSQMIRSVQAKQSEETGTSDHSVNNDALKSENTGGSSLDLDTDNADSINKTERNVDLSLTNGVGLMADPKEERGANELDKKEQTEASKKLEGYYKNGFEDAENLWTRILFMRKGVMLEGMKNVSGDLYIDLLGNGKPLDKKTVEILKNDADGEDMANRFYLKKDFYVNQIANAAVELILSREALASFFTVKFWFGAKQKEEVEAISKEMMKTRYIKGYNAQITLIEKMYKEQYSHQLLKQKVKYIHHRSQWR